MLKKFLIGMMCVVMIFFLTDSSVYAKEETGNIELSFQTDEAQNIDFHAHKIGEVATKLDIDFVPVAPFEHLNNQMNDLKTAKDHEELIELAMETIETENISPTCIAEVNEDKKAIFKDLPTGLYVIHQSEIKKDFKAENVVVSITGVKQGLGSSNVRVRPKFIGVTILKPGVLKPDNINANHDSNEQIAEDNDCQSIEDRESIQNEDIYEKNNLESIDTGDEQNIQRYTLLCLLSGIISLILLHTTKFNSKY